MEAANVRGKVAANLVAMAGQLDSFGQYSLFRMAVRTVLELGSKRISSDIIDFCEPIKNVFGRPPQNLKGSQF
jgi:hypothetical protein